MKLTCEDCIHYDICIFHLKGNENKDCLNFKSDAMKWIPVTERLPEKSGVVIGYDTRLGVGGFYYHYSLLDSAWKHVTHWMPLPELPKEG